MDDLERRALLCVLAKKFRELYQEKIAYQCVLQHLKDTGEKNIDGLVADALHSPELRAEVDRSLAFLERWIEPTDEDGLREWVRTWLQRWQPKRGEPN